MAPVHDVVISGVLFTISAVSLICNCMVLFTIYRYSSFLMNSFNVFVANLALVAIFNSALTTPLALNFLLSRAPKSITKPVCFIHSSSFCVVTTLLLTSLALMTINRYYRVVKPLDYQRTCTVKRSLLLLLSLWAINSVFVPAALASVTPVATYRLNRVDCFHLKEPLAGLFMYFFVFVAPSSTVVVMFYLKTHRFLYRPRLSTIVPSSHCLAIHVRAVEAKTLKILIVLLFSSYCCLLPVCIVWIIEVMLANPPYALSILGLLFEHLTSVVTPSVYIFVSRYYRKELHKLVTCKYNVYCYY